MIPPYLFFEWKNKNKGFTSMLKKASFPLLSMVCFLLLAACSNTQEPKLEGERKNILPSRYTLTPDVSVYSERLLLPQAKSKADWGQVGGGPSHVLGHILLSGKVRPYWKKSLGGGVHAGGALLNPPVAENGVLYTVNTQGEVQSIDLEKGKKLWEYQIEIREEDQLDLSSGLAIQEGVLYITTATGEILALNVADQTVLWRADIGVPVRSAPALDDEHVYIASHNNTLFVLSQKDGTLLWTHSGIEEELAIIGGAPPAISEGVVVVPYSSGEIYALDAKDGTYLWHDALSVNVGADPYSALVDVEASPVISDGVVYAVNHNGRLSAFDLKTGTRYWSREISATQMPWVAGNALFVVTDTGQLVCIHRRDGRIRWVEDLTSRLDDDEKDGAYWVGPILAGGRLIMTTNAGYALSVDPFKGGVQKVVEMPEGVTVRPIVVNETLVFMTEDARLVAFH